MKIPNKIRIGGQDIVIEMPEHLPDNKLGDICVAGGEIRIAKKFSAISNSPVARHIVPSFSSTRRSFIDMFKSCPPILILFGIFIAFKVKNIFVFYIIFKCTIKAS